MRYLQTQSVDTKSFDHQSFPEESMVRVTISGTPGSGKTTVAKILSQKKNLLYVYSGDIFRNLAKQYDMSLEEFGKYCQTHPEVDKELDDKQLQFLQQDNILVEGRLAGWLAHNHKIPAIKVFITADEPIRAQRIAQREGGASNKQKRQLQQRQDSEAQRYKTYYDIDITDVSIYDLVVDSSEKTAEQIAEMICICLP